MEQQEDQTEILKRLLGHLRELYPKEELLKTARTSNLTDFISDVASTVLIKQSSIDNYDKMLKTVEEKLKTLSEPINQNSEYFSEQVRLLRIKYMLLLLKDMSSSKITNSYKEDLKKSSPKLSPIADVGFENELIKLQMKSDKYLIRSFIKDVLTTLSIAEVSTEQKVKLEVEKRVKELKEINSREIQEAKNELSQKLEAKNELSQKLEAMTTQFSQKFLEMKNEVSQDDSALSTKSVSPWYYLIKCKSNNPDELSFLEKLVSDEGNHFSNDMRLDNLSQENREKFTALMNKYK